MFDKKERRKKLQTNIQMHFILKQRFVKIGILGTPGFGDQHHCR